MASSAYINLSNDMDRDIGSSKVHNFTGHLDYARPIRPSYSTLSFSASRFSAESGGTDCLDSELSPYISGGEPSSKLHDLESAHFEARENAKMRYKEKKKSRL